MGNGALGGRTDKVDWAKRHLRVVRIGGRRSMRPEDAERHDNRANDGLPSSNCLDQSLVLWWMLRRRGVAADMHIGGRKEAANFEAHAWVEVGSYTFPEMSGGHPPFMPFDRPIESVETQTR